MSEDVQKIYNKYNKNVKKKEDEVHLNEMKLNDK